MQRKSQIKKTLGEKEIERLLSLVNVKNAMFNLSHDDYMWLSSFKKILFNMGIKLSYKGEHQTTYLLSVEWNKFIKWLDLKAPKYLSTLLLPDEYQRLIRLINPSITNNKVMLSLSDYNWLIEFDNEFRTQIGIQKYKSLTFKIYNEFYAWKMKLVPVTSNINLTQCSSENSTVLNNTSSENVLSVESLTPNQLSMLTQDDPNVWLFIEEEEQRSATRQTSFVPHAKQLSINNINQSSIAGGHNLFAMNNEIDLTQYFSEHSTALSNTSSEDFLSVVSLTPNQISILTRDNQNLWQFNAEEEQRLVTQQTVLIPYAEQSSVNHVAITSMTGSHNIFAENDDIDLMHNSSENSSELSNTSSENFLSVESLTPHQLSALTREDPNLWLFSGEEEQRSVTQQSIFNSQLFISKTIDTENPNQDSHSESINLAQFFSARAGEKVLFFNPPNQQIDKQITSTVEITSVFKSHKPNSFGE